MELREQIAAMCESDSVKLRDIGVIAAALDAIDDRRGAGEVIDYIAAAKLVIKSQTEAGLATFRLMDLQAFIAEIKQRVDPSTQALMDAVSEAVPARPVWEGGTEGTHTEACDGEPHPDRRCPVDYP